MSTPLEYQHAPALYEEMQELPRIIRQLSLRERLLRMAALYDRQTLTTSPEDGKAQQPMRTAGLRLAEHDQENGTSSGPITPETVTTSAPQDTIRSYIRQEYAAWLTQATRG